MTTTTHPFSIFEIEQLVLAGQAHPTRIQILMVMGEDVDRKWSPSDMTMELLKRGSIVKGKSITLGGVAYHYRTLLASRWIVRAGKPGRVRGALENFYKIDGRRIPADLRS